MKKVEPSLVVQLKKANPCATQKEIGDQVGITRERVRQILLREGVPTASVRPYKHPCPQCGKRMCAPTKRGMCRTCYTKEWTYANLPCVWCGAIVRRQVSGITSNCRQGGYGRVFCNRHCYGKWLGEHFGFGRHPENQRKALLTRAARRSIVAAAELCPPEEKEVQP